MKSLVLGGLGALVLALMAWPKPELRADTGPAVTVASPSPIQRCMNMGGALEAEWEGYWGYTVRREDLETLAATGFDTIRLPVRVSAYTGTAPPYTISADLLARMDEIVGWATGLGLNIILDVHHYEALMETPGIELPRLEAIWDQLAAHYAGAPDTVMFEIINEPFGEMTPQLTNRTNEAILRRIRTTNPDRWVILGTPLWGGLDGMLKLDPPEDKRVIAGFHYYIPFDFTHQGATWMEDAPPRGAVWGTFADEKALQADFGKAAAWQRRTGVPILVGEFGVLRSVDPAQRGPWTRAVREASERNGMGWCYWDWGTEFAAWDQQQNDWVEPVRAALLDTAP
ncbi:MAG: glycoside hydrolase family 5 protein [Hyphomonas sp.]